MTPRDLQALILVGPMSAACAPHVHDDTAEKISAAEVREKDQSIADILNAAAAVRELRSRKIGYGAVLGLGAQSGAMILDKLEAAAEASSPVKWAMRLIAQGDLDIGAAETQAQVAALAAAGVLTAEECSVLMDLGFVGVQVSAAQVSNALRGPWE